MQTFEEFLRESFAELHPQILDDDLSDAFDNWEIDTDTLIEYGNLYGKGQYLQGEKSVLQMIKEQLTKE